VSAGAHRRPPAGGSGPAPKAPGTDEAVGREPILQDERPGTIAGALYGDERRRRRHRRRPAAYMMSTVTVLAVTPAAVTTTFTEPLPARLWGRRTLIWSNPS
jgi:hypothetical protein